MKREEVYTFLLESANLIDAHLKELSETRGFTKEIIASNRFRSSGKHLTDIAPIMKEKFSERTLLESGVFIPDGKNIRMAPMLLQDRIIIPYLNAKDEAYHLRFSLPKYMRDENKDTAKMLGFPGLSIDIYQEKNLIAGTYDVLVTEGEFKAVAGMQYKIPTLSIPGISSFADRHYPRLVEILKANKVKKVYILFDNEDKSDPELASYKPNPQERYYTQFYAVLMAYKLENSGFEVLVAWFPDSWRVQGKIDIDGALALGKTESEMAMVLHEAKPRNEFLKALSKDAYSVVQRKMAQNFHKSKIKREFNKYIASRERGRMKWDEEISNFVIKVIATHDTSEGMRRSVEFVSESGKSSSNFTISAKEMVSPDAFRVFCAERGDYVWRGTLEDLLTIWESEFLLQDEGRTIRESDHIGWLEKEKVWLFQNVCIKEDGTSELPDKDGIFWIEKQGIKPIPLSSDEKRGSTDGIPSLYIGTNVVEIKELHHRFSESIGESEASLMIGWITAVAFLEEVFSVCNSFPFLFVTGQWQSGKSTIAEFISNFFGIENAGKAISQTTAVAIQRCLAYYASLPTYLDEYRNSKEIIQGKNGFLRNAYNRQSSGKGTKTSYHSVREARVRGTLIIAGEETPKDGALWSRFITLYISKQNRTHNHYKWLMANRFRFSSHFLNVLKNKKALTPRFLEVFDLTKDMLVKQEIDDRVAFNYAAVVAGYEVVLGAMDIGKMKSLIGKTQDMQEEFKEERAVSVFYDDILAIVTRKIIDLKEYVLIEEGKIFIYFHGLHQVWSEQFRKSRGEEAFKEASIRSYLKEEPGYLEIAANKSINRTVKRCIVFDYETAPESIKNIANASQGSFYSKEPNLYSDFTPQSTSQDRPF